MILSSVSALSATYSKLGNEFSSTTGLYATSSHCITGDTCNWISGSQVIVGVYSGGFSGGSATWTFNITEPISQITGAELQLSWPSVYGKGLHSVGANTTSTITVGSTTIASPATSTAISCGNTDRYAYACFNAVPTYSIPISAISTNTNVTVSVPANTLWDIGTVKLVLTYSPPVACSTNAQCGVNDWVLGTNSCSGTDVYQNFKTYTCNNAGTTSSYCSNSTAFNLKTDCGDTTYGAWGANYCSANNVMKTRDVYNKGCTSGACTASTTQENQTVQSCTNGCTNGACNNATVACYADSDCGTNHLIDGTKYCVAGVVVFQHFMQVGCVWPGTTDSYCWSSSEGSQLIEQCADSGVGEWSANYCNGNIVEKSRLVTTSDGCLNKTYCSTPVVTTERQTIETCQYGCSNGTCSAEIACTVNPQCGIDDWVAGTNVCSGNNVYQNYKTFTCNNPGLRTSSCSNASTSKLKESCTAGCVSGVCNATTTGIKIVNGKIKIDGTEFLIKGLDYAPWLYGTGPDSTQWQKPFPTTRTQDVTDLVTSNGKVNVTDYSGDGRIQAWELIKFDVLTMKKLGANTIRTYATGSWHDKDLDGVQDAPVTNPDKSEIVQGDLTDWVLDELLTQANSNGMKVIIGYWVQEENFTSAPYIADWSDLPVAKQAFGRVVNKYKSNPAVLGWGIGNEVNGTFNQGWFSWGVSVNDYLNALFAYTRTLDTAHPIIYAKYIGENTNFNNLTADIMSINAYIHSADELVNYGEFNIAAPAGKAYMLGEYGHLIEQAAGHWALAKNYAGGAFLEYNNVWWKGSGHNVFGIVDEYRAINTERYNVLNALYGGAPVCSTNAECGTNITGTNTCNANQVVRTNTIYTCSNPGTQSASCSSTNQTEVVQTCTNSCSNGACVIPIACSTNTQCGINDWIAGTNSCSGTDVYQNFKTYTCNNPGTINSSCSNATVFQLKSDCGDTTTSAWSANYCTGKNVEKSRTVYNKGCDVGACTATNTTETQLVQTCANNCLNGSCTAVCSTASQCGTNGYLNTPTCSGSYVKDMYRTYSCVSPGTTSSRCSFTDVLKTKQTCLSTQICSNGACVVPTCKYDSQCNDNVVLTIDKCVNPNTINSSCTHTPIACTTSTQCGVNAWLGQTVCNGNSVGDYFRTFTCKNPGTISSYCSSVDVLKTKAYCLSTQICNNGACLTPVCKTNTQCGTTGYSANTCDGSNVVKTYTANTCLNPNTVNSVCDRQQTTTVVESCVNGCSAGKCLPPPCGFNDGVITVSAEAKAFTAWDISQVQLLVTSKVGTLTKTYTLTKNGNDISSGEGAYATLASCGGICNWISGNQVIVGAYNSTPSNWGGKVNYNFDLTGIDKTKISQVVVKVYRPNVYGKGLHSPLTTGSGVLKLEDMTLATLLTKTAKCGTDWFGHTCATTTLSYTKAINSTTCNIS